MDIAKAFSFQFKDPRWIHKLAIGAVIAIVPILNFALSGYLVDLIGNVSAGVVDPLPEWDDMEGKFKIGFLHVAAGFVYALPMVIVFCLPLSLFFISGLLSGNENMQSAAQSLATAGGALFYCLLCVFLLYGLVLSVIYPAILVVFSRERTFAACFKFRHVIDLVSRNPGPFFTAWAVNLGAGLGIGLVFGLVNLVLAWIPCIGQIIALVTALGSSVYIATIYGHLFGQFSAIAFASEPKPGAS